MKVPPTTIEGPEEMTDEIVEHWEPLSKSVKGTAIEPWLNKAYKIRKAKAIEKTGNLMWTCKPFDSEHHKTYTITSENGKQYCNCQGFKSRVKSGMVPICVHTIVVHQFEFIKKYNQERTEGFKSFKD
jgi:hypothetical protein